MGNTLENQDVIKFFTLVMEKEQVIENLRQRVGENDFSERSLDEFVTPLLSMFADDTKITEETWTPLVSILKTSNGQNRHSVAEGIKAGLAEKEAALSEKETKIAELMKEIESLKNVQKPDDKPDTNKDGLSPEIKAILEKMESDRAKDAEERQTLLEKISGMEKAQLERESAAKISDAKSNLLSFLKESNATNEAVINLAISDVEIKADSKISDLKILVKAAYEKRFKEFYPNGGQPFGGNGSSNGGSQSNSDGTLKAYIEEQAKLNQSNAQYAENLQGTFK